MKLFILNPPQGFQIKKLKALHYNQLTEIFKLICLYSSTRTI